MNGAVCAQGIPIPGNELIAVFDADQVARREVRHSAMMQLALTASLLATGNILRLKLSPTPQNNNCQGFYNVFRLSCKASCPLCAQ